MRIFGLRVDLHPTAALPGLLAAAATYALSADDPHRARNALIRGALWYEAAGNHLAGHLLSSQLAGAPMDRIDWGVRAATLYDNNDVSPQQHIGRAIGGPLGSSASMLAWWVIWLLLRRHPLGRFALSALIYNTLFALLSWLPIPTGDGATIWSNIRKL